MILLLSIFLPLISIYYYYYYLRNKAAKVKTLVPGPPPLPLIGNLHQFGAGAGDLHVNLWQLSTKYGPIVQLKLGSVPVIVVSSAKLAEQVLKTQDLAFCGRPKSPGLKKLTYSNSDIVFSPYSDYWREMRRIASIHLFAPKRAAQSLRSIREEEISLTIAGISRSAAAGEAVDLSEAAVDLSNDLISRIACGRKGEEFGRFLREFAAILGDYLFVSDYFPGLGWVDGVIGSRKKIDRCFENMDSLFEKVIEEHVRGEGKGVEEEDFLDTLIRLKQQQDSSINLTWDHIKALLMVSSFLF